MARILCTGSNGLIGRHLVNYLLEQGHDLICVDDLSNSEEVPEWHNNKRVTVLEADITDPWAPSAISCMGPFSCVAHLACHPYECLSQFEPSRVSRSVLVGTTNVLTAAINVGAERFCNVSSLARYGSGRSRANLDFCHHPPFNEQEHIRHPEDIYAVAKVAAELNVQILCDMHEIAWCHAVPHNVTGEANLKALADPYRGVILIWTNQLLRGKAITIFGDGGQKRAPSYVADIIPVLAQMVVTDNADGHIVNIGAKRAYTINEIAGAVMRAFQSITGRTPAGIQYEETRHEVKDAYCSVDKSVRLLGYEDKTSLDEMAERVMRWAYAFAPNGVEPRYIEKLAIEQQAPRAWVERRM